MRRALLCLICCVCAAIPAAAQDELAREVAAAQRALDDTRAQAVRLAERVQGAEAALLTLERRIADLETQRAELSARMDGARAQTERLLATLARLRRTPPGAHMLRTDIPPADAARTGLVLRSTTEALEAQTADVRRQIAALAALEADLAAARARAVEQADTLKAQQAELAALTRTRTEMLAKLKRDHAAAAAQAREIGRTSRDLPALLRGLVRGQGGAPPPKPTYGAATPRLPVSGVVRVPFGATDTLGARAQGLTIAARPGALVVAPTGGTVRFAGPFRDYGQMVIVEQTGGGRHALVAGLGEITTVVGARVVAGEPIGALPQAQGAPEVYYELRAAGRPVDPAPGLLDDEVL